MSAFSRSHICGLVAAAMSAFATLLPAVAHADDVKVALRFDAEAGVEGAVGGDGVRRTRTSLAAGLAGWSTGAAAHRASLLVRAEVEPDASIGGEVGYTWLPEDTIALRTTFAFAAFPDPLFGASLSGRYRGRLSDSVFVTIGPSVRMWFAGNDLVDAPIVQGTLTGGLELNL